MLKSHFFYFWTYLFLHFVVYLITSSLRKRNIPTLQDKSLKIWTYYLHWNISHQLSHLYCSFSFFFLLTSTDMVKL